MERDSPEGRTGDSQDQPVHEIESTITITALQEWLKGRYLLERELGRGGFGITYLASDMGLSSRRVVVKVLLKHRSQDEWSLKKFRSEVDALARIDHPGVVTVMDCGELPDGRPFIVMQYVSGKPLRKLIPRTGMPLSQVADILLQTGRAVSAAHEAGVLHRDLKPENIMLQSRSSGEEFVRVIDFGLAAIQDPEVAAVASSKVAGTLQYMAPEQFEGKSSAATDVYQLGVVAYELVTGIAPFRSAGGPAMLAEKTKPVKVAPRDLRPDLPEDAERAILRAISPEPANRQRTPREFGEEMTRALLGVTHAPTPGPYPPTAGNGARKHFWPSALRDSRVIAMLAGALAIIGIAWWMKSPHPAANRVAVLPFENRTRDPDAAYVADGITEALINDLSHIPGLKVSARGAILRFENASVNPQAAARALSANRVVLGSVWKTDEGFRISVELMDTASASRIWGDTYTATASSLSTALATVSADVTDQLRAGSSVADRQRRARQYATNPAAYHSYLKGRFYMNKGSDEALNTAIQNFETAISADPSYAPAYAAMAYAYTLIAFNASSFAGSFNTTQAALLEDARTAANRALRLDATLAEAWTSLALVQMQADYDWTAAQNNFHRALDLDPNLADTRESLGIELAALGRTDDGLREISIAETLAPGNLQYKVARAFVLYNARRYKESVGVLNSTIRDKRDAASLGDVFAADYWGESKNDLALSAVLGLPDASTDRAPLIAAAYARDGQRARARALLEQYLATMRIASWYDVALAEISLDKKAEAIEDLNRAIERRSSEVLFIAVDPMLDPLRSEAGFQKLLKKMKLTTNVASQ